MTRHAAHENDREGTERDTDPDTDTGTDRDATVNGRAGIAVEVRDRAVVVRPAGELDVDRAAPLRAALTEALAHASAAVPVVVDCSGITFCDSTGLNAFLSARLAAEEAGTRVDLAHPTGQLRRLLEITGADSVFPGTGTVPG